MVAEDAAAATTLILNYDDLELVYHLKEEFTHAQDQVRQIRSIMVRKVKKERPESLLPVSVIQKH